MIGSEYSTYLQGMSEDIQEAALSLAKETEEKVPEVGSFGKISIPFKDKRGELEITDWRLRIFELPEVNGPNSDQRFIELLGILDGGCGVTIFVFSGTKDQCIHSLRDSKIITRIQNLMIKCLINLD